MQLQSSSGMHPDFSDERKASTILDMDPKTFFTRWNGEFDPEEFDEWVDTHRHSPKTIFPDGPIAREISEFEAKELISLLENSISNNWVLSPDHTHYGLLPNFLRCKFVDGCIDSEILLTSKISEDPTDSESLMFRGEFKSGFPHGKFQVYDITEKLIEEYELAFGVPHGRWTRYDRGIPLESIEYAYNSRHGERRQYHQSGRLKTIAIYKDGKRIGPQKYFEDKD